ncbi:MAG TPA: indolepyruvate ferredoxin oxidoreductase family protein, partial [Paracoccus sp.]|nr:indolepyruvate ferredoxin oxidoreductase family protein [Paracoccus sp. (in: a-proteobacteria)]
VHIHCRIAEKPQDISAVRVAVGEAHCVIGGDLVVTAGARTLGLMRSGQTGAVVNAHEIITGEFTRNTEFQLPTKDLRIALEARLRDRLALFDASELAQALLGDAIYSNMMVFGGAWQMGLIPVSLDAIEQAIKLNKAAVEGNLRAFEIGRWAVSHPAEVAKLLNPAPEATAPVDPIAYRADHLVAYQNAALARRFRALVDPIEDEALRLAVAKGYHKLLSYKDEYEVARLHLQTMEKARAAFDGDFTPSFHLAPPILGGTGADGRPRKRRFGAWMLRGFGVLARFKGLRGTPLDPFGRSAERRMERALIAQYEADMADLLPRLTQANRDAVLELALLPLSIRGFGPVKEANAKAAARRREELLAAIATPGAPLPMAAE